MGFAVIYQGIIWGIGETKDDAIDEALYCLNLGVEPHERSTAEDIVVPGPGFRQTAWNDENNHPVCLPATDDLVQGITDETFDPERLCFVSRRNHLKRLFFPDHGVEND